jgi:hypothetical protein
MQIVIDVVALHNENSKLRYLVPVLKEQQTDDKIRAEHFKKNQALGELSIIFSFVCQQYSVIINCVNFICAYYFCVSHPPPPRLGQLFPDLSPK